jgi:hypothetical protein
MSQRERRTLGARDLKNGVQPISQSVQRRDEVCAEDGPI